MQHDCKVSPYNSLAHENVLQYCPSQTKMCEIQRQETKDKQENRREKKQRTMRKAARLSTFFFSGEIISNWRRKLFKNGLEFQTDDGMMICLISE